MLTVPTYTFTSLLEYTIKVTHEEMEEEGHPSPLRNKSWVGEKETEGFLIGGTW